MKGREPAVWQYDLGDDWVAMAGKTDEDNEMLSLNYAWPNDYWFHVRGMPGSHVVLSHPDSVEPSRALLEQAAGIAAYHSKARKGGVVAVSYCQVKNVKKAHGASTGTVRISKEKVIKVRPAIP